MPRLGEVLGGLLTDVVRARLAADALTAEALDAYRANPVLASMSVPRVTVSDMKVRLHFVVSEVAVPEPRPIDVEQAQTQWNAALRERVLPRLLQGRDDDAVREDVQRLREALDVEPVVGDPDLLGRVVEGEVGPFADVSVSALLDRVRALPAAARRRLGTLAQLRQDLQREVAREAALFAERLRQSQAIEQALRSRLQVEVVSGLLQQTPAEQLQEVEVTVSMADLEDLLAVATDTER